MLWLLRKWEAAVVLPCHEKAIKERNNNACENRFNKSCHMLMVEIKLNIFIAQRCVAIDTIRNDVVQVMRVVVR